MKSDSKVVNLVVNKQPKHRVFGITIGTEIKYMDDEVVLVKTSVGLNDEKPKTSHIIVEIPQD